MMVHEWCTTAGSGRLVKLAKVNSTPLERISDPERAEVEYLGARHCRAMFSTSGYCAACPV
jgi:hypothetical protein